jgi:hypothetical protein
MSTSIRIDVSIVGGTTAEVIVVVSDGLAPIPALHALELLELLDMPADNVERDASGLAIARVRVPVDHRGRSRHASDEAGFVLREALDLNGYARCARLRVALAHVVVALALEDGREA